MHGLAELIGIIVCVIGGGVLVAAALTVSLGLALLTAGVLLVIVGVITIYVAMLLSPKPATPPKPEVRP